MRFYLYIFFLLIPLICSSQSGSPYLRDYHVPMPNVSIFHNDVLQLSNGDMLLANERALLLYNGTSWNRILIEDKPRVLFRSPERDNAIFIGSKNSFGFLSIGETGSAIYQNLLDTLPGESGILDIREDMDRIYFQSTGFIYPFDKKENRLLSPIMTGNSYLVLFNLDSLLYALTNDQLFLINGDSMQYKRKIVFPDPVVTDIRWSDDKVLLVTRKGGLYIFDGNELILFNTSADRYLEGNLVTYGIEVSEETIVIGTLTGGMVVLEKASGKALQFINFQTGLPDDEVRAMCLDDQEGIWLCHGLGLSRADINLPVRNFSQYPGLAGDISCIRKIGNDLFVGTNEGLFFLSKVNDISEISYLIRKERTSRNDFQSYRRYKTFEKKVKITLTPTDTARYGEMIREIPFKVSLPIDSVVNTVTTVFSDELVRKEYALQSIPYMFKKFSGLEARCNQLLVSDSSLIVATNKGLFLLKDLKLQTLIAEKKLNFVIRSSAVSDIFFAGGDEGVFSFSLKDGSFHLLDVIDIKHVASSIVERKRELIVTAENKIFRISLGNDFKILDYKQIWESNGDNICIGLQPDSLLLLSGKTCWKSGLYDTITGIFDKSDTRIHEDVEDIVYSQSGKVWIYSGGGWNDAGDVSVDTSLLSYLNLFRDVRDIYLDPDSSLWLAKDNGVYRIRISPEAINRIFRSRIASIRDRRDQELELDEVNLRYQNNSVFIHLASPYYLGERTTQYRYKLDELRDEWSAWSLNPEVAIQYLEPGSYSLRIQTKNVLGQLYDIGPLSIKISPPFWRSWWFILTLVLVLILLVRLIILYRTKALERENRILQSKVDKATSEILAQKNQIEGLYTDIRSSINYAERIQRAILPKTDQIKAVLPDSFLLYKPQDIVSGDFYWFHDTDEYFIIIATDCTGHGVPGAFMSMIGNTLLNQIIKMEKVIDPASILYRLDADVISSLQQEQDTHPMDGMDLAVCTYFKEKQELHFAGAMNGLYLFQDSGFYEIPADFSPVGGVFSNMNKEFTTQKIKLESDAIVYIYSDGYYTQLGGPGPGRKKFNRRQFRDMLNKIKENDFQDQESELDHTIEQWLGERKQNDDILVIGFKIKINQ